LMDTFLEVCPQRRYVRIELPCEMETITVNLNPQWLHVAFQALVANSVDAFVEGAPQEIRIETRLSDPSVEFWFKDTGSGIPPDIRDRLFQEPIPHGKDSGQDLGFRTKEGFGVGLLMALVIVETYGGQLRLAETTSNGTTMVISLPLGRAIGGNGAN